MPNQGWAQTLITAQVNGTALTAAAAASALPPAAKYTLSPNFLSIGSQFLIKACGKISTVITTPGTVRFDVRFGAVVVFDSLAILPDTVAGHSNVGFLLEIWLTCVSIGASTSAAFMGHGTFTSELVKGSGTMPLGSLVANLPWNTTPANGTGFDSTVTNVVDLFFTQTVATGSMTLQQYALVSMN